MQNPIEAMNLTRTFGDLIAVDGISLAVSKGAVFGFLGPNGAGKTSLFYIIMGLIKSESGSINLDKTQISEYPMYRRSKLGLGYLPQESSIFRGMNVEENILSIFLQVFFKSLSENVGWTRNVNVESPKIFAFFIIFGGLNLLFLNANSL